MASNHKIPRASLAKAINHNIRLLAKFNKRTRLKKSIVNKVLRIATFIGRSSIANSVGVERVGIQTKVNGLPELGPFAHSNRGSIFMALTGKRGKDRTKAYRLRRAPRPSLEKNGHGITTK